jgi:hypothetical protein
MTVSAVIKKRYLIFIELFGQEHVFEQCKSPHAEASGPDFDHVRGTGRFRVIRIIRRGDKDVEDEEEGGHTCLREDEQTDFPISSKQSYKGEKK